MPSIDELMAGANGCFQKHIFRYVVSTYLSRRREIVTKSCWRYLKGKSHSSLGTNQREFSPIDDFEESGDAIIEVKGNPVDGQLYEAILITDGTDFETGVVDEYHWEMIPYGEGKDQHEVK